jgi:hypothetical protein
VPCRQDIGGAEQIGEPVKMAFIIPAGSLPDNNGFRSVGFNNGIKSIGDCIQGFIPGNSLPPIAAFIHGIQDSIRMIGQLRHRKPLAAQGTIAERRIRVPFDPDHFTVLYVGDDPASAMTVSAGGPDRYYIFHKFLLILFNELKRLYVSKECNKLKLGAAVPRRAKSDMSLAFQ